MLAAVESFLGRMAPASWPALVFALVLYLCRIGCSSRAWRNILAAAYPDAPPSWRGIFGATTAGMAAATFVPAKGGELLRLVLARRQIPSSSYATLAATLVVETIFPFVAAVGFLVAAVRLGALPGAGLLPPLDVAGLPASRPLVTALAATAAIAGATAAAVLLRGRAGALRARFAHGFAVLGNRGDYLRRVVPWQALDWLLRLAALYWFLRAFGLAPSFHNAFAVQVAQNMSALVPLTPSGIGTEQALIVSSLAGPQPAGDALGFSVGMKAALVTVNVAVGFTALLLLARTIRWRRLVSLEAPVQRS